MTMDNKKSVEELMAKADKYRKSAGAWLSATADAKLECEKLRAERDALRAELAAEREKTAELQEWLKENGQTIGEFVASNKGAWDRAHKAEAERDAARAELAARHAMLVRVRNYLYFLPSRDRALIDDIDALLQEKTDEG